MDKWTEVETATDRQENENLISDLVQSTTCNDQRWGKFMPTISNSEMLNNPETKTNNSFKFLARCEFTHSQRSDSENLLEAVVASVCCSDSDTKWSKSSVNQSNPFHNCNSDLQTSGSICYSLERSLKGFSSASVSRCSEQINRPREPAKAGKKRSRPGESGKPRPRDRQLIQDRIKKLRKLLPSGSKCSIDSLLERTIKHMLFMQCITKHADKIGKCAEYKVMEVGNELKLCPIIVENIGTEGQMLVAMVCDEGVNFLEIAEAVRSLGLAIIKGVYDAYGDKTWMCFIVEVNPK
ncbi:putative transcription factor bHLH family [Helianthus anomalus]